MFLWHLRTSGTSQQVFCETTCENCTYKLSNKEKIVKLNVCWREKNFLMENKIARNGDACVLSASLRCLARYKKTSQLILKVWRTDESCIWGVGIKDPVRSGAWTASTKPYNIVTSGFIDGFSHHNITSLTKLCLLKSTLLSKWKVMGRDKPVLCSLFISSLSSCGPNPLQYTQRWLMEIELSREIG